MALKGNAKGPCLSPVFKQVTSESVTPLLHLPEHSFSSSELHLALSPTPVWNELCLVLGELTFQKTNRNLQN